MTWQGFKLDVLILSVGLIIPCISFLADVLCQQPYHFFARSGAIMVIASAYLAFGSLRRHALKAKVLFEERKWSLTSKKQLFFDWSAIILSIVGTLLWAYGDFVL